MDPEPIANRSKENEIGVFRQHFEKDVTDHQAKRRGSPERIMMNHAIFSYLHCISLSLSTYIYIYTLACVCVCMYIYILLVHICIYIYTYINKYIYIFVYSFICVCM